MCTCTVFSLLQPGPTKRTPSTRAPSCTRVHRERAFESPLVEQICSTAPTATASGPTRASLRTRKPHPPLHRTDTPDRPENTPHSPPAANAQRSAAHMCWFFCQTNDIFRGEYIHRTARRRLAEYDAEGVRLRLLLFGEASKPSWHVVCPRWGTARQGTHSWWSMV